MRSLPLALIVAVLLAGCPQSAPPAAERGAELAQQKGCLSCHSTDGSVGPGPTWKGLYLSDVELEDGRTVLADEAYLEESMLQPSAQTVKGYREGLMESVIKPDSLTDEEVEALIAYIESLR